MSKFIKYLIKVCTFFTISMLLFIIIYILINGIPNLSPKLFNIQYTSENLSMMPAIITTLMVTVLTLLIAVPIGVGSGIYLVEYANQDSRFVHIIRLATESLAGIPSIIYGLFGMLFFVFKLGMKFSVLACVLTAVIMVLPLIIRTTEEALLSVNDSYRSASFGLGAGKLHTIFHVVLPSAVNGILAGVILAIGRIVGETAAFMYTLGTSTDLPKGLLSSGRTLALHMYVLSGEGFHVETAYATAVVLLIMVILINAMSTALSNKLKKG